MPLLPHELDLALRLLVAAILGAGIGAEREFRGHEAGMRTHLLLAEGSALFTVISIYGFPTPEGGMPADPSRVAAQIVSGVGFLGAGAIIKFGINVRGLTTAASLWAVAAVGMACGAGSYLVAGLGTAIVLLSLGPLKTLGDRLSLPERRAFRIRVALAEGTPIGILTDWLSGRDVEIRHLDVARGDGSRLEVDLRVRLPTRMSQVDLMKGLETIPGVFLLESGSPAE
ncbi:MAG: MgtC/SapB family protein [Chloroflexota bacterium]